MPAKTLGFAEVEERLRRIRLRLNLLALQHVLYVWGSVVFLILGATLALKSLSPPEVSRFATPIAALVILAAAAIAALSIRSRWISLGDTAHFADRSGDLKDRLATLLAVRSSGRGSRFSSFLLTQTIGLAGRWEPSSLVPRRFPRTIYVMLASALTFVCALLFLPPPPSPADASLPPEVSQPEPPTDEPAEPEQAFEPEGRRAATIRGAEGLQLDPAGGFPADAGGVGENALDTGAQPAEDLPADSPDISSGSDPSAVTQPGPAPSEGSELDGDELTGSAEAPGTGGELEDDSPQELSDGKGDNSESNSVDGPSDESDESDESNSESADGLPDGAQNEPQEDASAVEPDSAPSDTTAKGGAKAAGEGGSQGSAGLFGEMEGEGEGMHDEPQKFSLKLSSESFTAPTKLEPQGQPQNPGSVVAGTGTAREPTRGEIPADLPNDALKKADVAQEYEEVVREIFRRD